MRKKFMMVAVLLGALTLGACVDDNESASVTAVREAKAEQLQSIADLNKAEAEATTLLAQSQAAIDAAKARQEAALADKMEAEARIAEIQAKMAEETYDAELAARLAEAEAAKKRAEADLQAAQAEIEQLTLTLQIGLAKLQAQLLDAQKELKDKQDEQADEALQELQDLANTYATTLTSYTRMEQNIASEEATLASLKADLADWEVINAASIAAEEFKIEVYNKQIAAFKQYENYTEDIENLKLQLTDAELAMNVANEAYLAAVKADNEVDVNKLKEAKGVDKLRKAVEEDELYKMLDFANKHGYYPVPGGISIGEYIPVALDENGYVELKWKGFQITSENGEYTYNVYDNDSLYIKLEYKDVRRLRIDIDNTIASYDIATKKKAVTDCETAYNTAVKATATAKAAYEAAPTDAEKKAAYETALSEEQRAKSYLEQAQAELEEYNGYVEELETAYKLVSDQTLGTALQTAVKAYNEAVVAAYTEKTVTYFAQLTARDAYTEKEMAYNTLNAIANGSNNGNNFISLWELLTTNIINDITADNTTVWGPYFGYDYATSCDVLMNTYIEYYINGSNLTGAISIDEAIKALEESIKASEERIAELKDVTDQENQIELTQANIDGLKVKAAALKIKVDAVKASLDEKMAAYTEEPAA